MKTEIILKKSYEVIATYDFPISLSKGDVVEDKNNMEHVVDCTLFDMNSNTLRILVV